MTLNVFLDEEEKADGQLYMDDGSSIGKFFSFYTLAVLCLEMVRAYI